MSTIAEGDWSRALSLLLGQPHFVDGVVVRGDQRGRVLGFPTANLQVNPRVAVCRNGKSSELRVEAHLLDHDADLYGEWPRSTSATTSARSASSPPPTPSSTR